MPPVRLCKFDLSFFMPKESKHFKANQLRELLDGEHQEMQDLLVKVINVCCESQIDPPSENQMKDRVRKEIDNSVARKRIL